MGIQVAKWPTHTMYDMDLLISQAAYKAPTTYYSFLKLLDKVGKPKQPSTTLIPLFPQFPNLDSIKVEFYKDIPTLTEIGYDEK